MTAETAGATPREDEPVTALVRLWRGYARKVYGDECPLYRAMARAVSEDAEILAMLLECPPAGRDPNMLLAAIQYLVMGGAPHPLAAGYERAASFATEPVPETIGAVVHDFCRTHRQELVDLLSSRHVQTNETGRCGPIALGLSAAATHIGEPIALLDDGASAGLNLLLDEYFLDFGPQGSIGPADSPVHLRCHVRSGALPQPLRLPAIGPRRGIDRTPVAVDDEDTVRWMLACIWPGTGRQERARAAFRLAGGHRGLVRRGDMLADLGPVLAEMRPHPTVVVTSWSYSYLPPAARAGFQQVLREGGRSRPVAWVCCDLLGTVPMFDPPSANPEGGPIPSVLGVAVFRDGGVDGGPLGLMHSHGTWLEWFGSH